MTLELLLFFCLAQDPATAELSFGKPTEQIWPVSGSATVADQTLVQLTAQRVERSWTGEAVPFREVPSETVSLTTKARVVAGAFTGRFKASLEGIYQGSVGLEERTLGCRRSVLGPAERLVERSADGVAVILEVAERMRVMLNELEQLSKSKVKPSAQQCSDFFQRLAVEEQRLWRVAYETDFSATHRRLQPMFAVMRNARVWPMEGEGGVGDAARNDAPPDKGFFNATELSLTEFREMLASVPRMVSLEARASVASLLETLLPGDAERARVVAGAAFPMLEKVPQPDKAFNELVRTLPKLPETELPAFHASIHGQLEVLVRK